MNTTTKTITGDQLTRMVTELAETHGLRSRIDRFGIGDHDDRRAVQFGRRFADCCESQPIKSLPWAWLDDRDGSEIGTFSAQCGGCGSQGVGAVVSWDAVRVVIGEDDTDEVRARLTAEVEDVLKRVARKRAARP